MLTVILPTGLARVYSSEWIKFSSIRSNWVTFVVLLVFAALSVGSSSYFGLPGGVDYKVVDARFDGAAFAQLAVGLLAVLIGSSDFKHGTALPLFSSEPSRQRVMAGKYLFTAVLSMCVVVAFLALAFLVALVLGSSTDGFFQEWQSVLRVSLTTSVYGVLGLSLGLIARSAIVGISVLMGSSLVEAIVVEIFATHTFTDYLPVQSIDIVGDFYEPVGSMGGSVAACLFWQLAFTGLAYIRTVRVDVTSN